MREKSPVFKLKRFLLYLIVLIYVVALLFPIYWILVTSLQDGDAIYFIPRGFTLANYVTIFTSDRFSIVIPLINSLRVSLATTSVCILLGVLSAYAFARLKFKGSNTLFLVLIFTEMLPPIALLIPFFLLYQRLHLFNTWYGLVIGYVAWLLPITTWVLYSYFQSIPKDLEEAARADGATRVGALFKIILPVSAPGIIAATVICFMFSMGEFLFAITVATAEKAHTLTVNMNIFITKFQIEYGYLSATTIITLLFPVILVLILQRFLIDGLKKGAVKE